MAVAGVRVTFPQSSSFSHKLFQQLKRAFRMYTSTGEKSSCTTGFTLVNVNNAVEAYAQSAAKISESRWKRLQDLCGVLVADAATLSMEDTEVFEISASRHLMYDASSPPPESK